MSSDKPLYGRSDVECMTITIVGVLGPVVDADAANAQLGALMQDIEAAVYAHYPGFQPAYPPVAIMVVSLPELRTPDA
jgi:hypothetical protein